MIEKFTLPVFDTIEKSLTIDGTLPLEFDFDDVWHEEVKAKARAIVKVLNQHLPEIDALIPDKYK